MRYILVVLLGCFLWGKSLLAGPKDSLSRYSVNELYDKARLSSDLEDDTLIYIYTGKIQERLAMGDTLSHKQLYRSLSYRIDAATNLKKHVEVNQVVQRLLSFSERYYGISSREYVNALYLMACNSSIRTHYDSSLLYTVKAASIAIEMGDSLSSGYAAILREKAIAIRALGDIDSAQVLLEQSIDISSKVNGLFSQDGLISEARLARIYYDQNRIDTCYKVAKKIIKACEELNFTKLSVYSDMLFILTVMDIESGQLKLAELNINKLKLLNKGMKPLYDYDSKLLDLEYYISLSMGNVPHCIEVSLKHLELIDLLKGGDKSYKLPHYERLAGDYADIGAFKKSKAMYRDLIHELNTDKYANKSILLGAYANKARLHSMIGEREASTKYISLAFEVYKEYEGEFSNKLHRLYSTAIGIYVNAEKWDKAQEFIFAILDLGLPKSPKNKTPQDYLIAYEKTSYIPDYLYPYILHSINQWIKGNNIFEKEYRAANADLLNLGVFLLERMSRNIIGTNSNFVYGELVNEFWLNYITSLDDNDVKASFNAVEQNKAINLQTSIRERLLSNIDGTADSLLAEIKQIYDEKSVLEVKIKQLEVEDDVNLANSEIESYLSKLAFFEKKLAAAYGKSVRQSYSNRFFSVDAIQQTLDDTSAIIEYFITDSIVHIYKVDKDTVMWKKVIWAEADLNKSVNSLKRILDNADIVQVQNNKIYEEYLYLGHLFYTNLIEPVLAGDTKSKRLIIIADGQLSFIPFDIFITENIRETSHQTGFNRLPYLLNKYIITYDYSSNTWLYQQNAKLKKTEKDILGISLNKVPYCEEVNYADPNLILPVNSNNEVSFLESNFGGDFLYNEEAQKSKIKELIPAYNIIHLATHGVINRDIPRLSGLLFSKEDNDIGNGIWYGYEIEQSEINANLVVLPGCETGGGILENGAGIASFARSFMYANVPALVVSLWQTQDKTTTDIMVKFYENLDKGQPKDVALRNAKLTYIQENPNVTPGDWATFIHIGNYKPIQLLRNNVTTYWAVLCAIIAAVVALLVWRKQYR